jgi:hypothetical protein
MKKKVGEALGRFMADVKSKMQEDVDNQVRKPR